MPRVVLFGALLLLAALASVHAQASTASAVRSELQPGARVRIEAPGILAGRPVATVLSSSNDTLTVGGPGTVPVVVPIARISSLQISKGKSHSLGAIRGFEWGTSIGAVFGVATASGASNCTSCNPQERPTAGGWIAFSAVAGAVWGSAIGAAIGRERWESFDVSRRTALGVRPGGMALSMRLGF
jgi:hypothetical protein